MNTPGHAPIWVLPQQHRACPSSWSRAPSSHGWLQKRCLLPQGSTRSAEGLRHPFVPAVELKLRHDCDGFSTVLDVINHVFGIQRTSCTKPDSESVSAVLFHHDLIGSARISVNCRTSRHRLLNVFQHLRTHRHLQLLTDYVTHTSCRQRAQPTSLSQRTNSLPCAAVFSYISSGSCQERTVYQCLHEEHSSTPAERDNQEREFVSELHTRGKALELFVLLEVCLSPVVLRRVGVVLHLQCGFQDQATVSLCPGYVIRQA